MSKIYYLLLGVELNWRRFDSYYITRELPPIDLYEPEYGNFEQSDLEPTAEEKLDPPGTYNSVGLYAQDLVAIGEQVKIIFGGRLDFIEESDYFGDEESEINDFSPRVGIVYQPLPPLSLYANYASSFNPEFGRDREGNPFVPITGEQFEVGLKGEFLDRRLAATLSAYQITRANDLVTDPVDDFFSIQIGESRSRGIDFDLRGEPLPGLSLIATYAYINAEVTEDAAGLEGSKLPTPEHSGSLWTVYEFQEGVLKGFGLGGGVFVTGEVPEDTGSTETNPSAARTAALLYYQRDNWRSQLNIDNLFDAEYFENSRRGEPFTIRGQISAEF